MGCLADTVGTTLTCDARTGRVNLAELGVTERECTDFMSGDYPNLSAFLTDRIAMAERVVTSDVLGRYAGRVRVNTFLDNGRIGDFGDKQELQTATAGTDNGLVLEVCAPQANLKIEVSRIEVYTDVAGPVDVRFYDLADGSLLATETITAVADRITAVEVSIQFVARRRKMSILVVTDLPTFYRSTAGKGGCSTCKGDTFIQGIVRGYGAFIDTSAAYSVANVDHSSYTAGLAVVATVVCDHAAWLCEIKQQMVLPMGMQVAKQVMVYGVENLSRLNNSNSTKERLENTINKANRFQNEYAAAMDLIFKNAPLPTDEVCFDCNRSSRHAIAIP